MSGAHIPAIVAVVDDLARVRRMLRVLDLAVAGLNLDDVDDAAGIFEVVLTIEQRIAEIDTKLKDMLPISTIVPQ